MIYQDIYPQLQQPRIDTSTWSFSIGGRVQHPVILSYSDLLQMPMVEITCAVLCAGSLFDESSIEQATWRGVTISALLEHEAIDSTACYAVLHNAAGYHTSLSMDWLMSGVLALEQDGKALSPEQGHPARLVVPGLYGYKSPRWVERIELSCTPQGFWESRGWEGDGTVPTVAAFTRPHSHSHVQGAVLFEGFAYSGDQRVAAIEVSVDYADWMPVDFAPAPPAALVRWQAVWTPPTLGDYYVRVRATDDSGYVQAPTAVRTSVFSSRRDTLHSIIVHVVE